MGIKKEKNLHAHGLLGGVDLVEDDEGEHGVGGDADVVGGEAGVELERSAGGHGLGAAVSEALEGKGAVGEGLLLLELSLDVIEGEGEERGEETGDGGGADGGGKAGDAVGLHHLLGLVVGREHTAVRVAVTPRSRSHTHTRVKSHCALLVHYASR